VTLDTLELFGVQVNRFRPRTTLSVAYISLSVSTEDDPSGTLRHHRAFARHGLGHELRIADWRKDDQQAEEATVRVETALGRAPRTLIRGEAGSGKSTLLRWLAISAARSAFTGDLADWNDCVPFLIKLRSHADRPMPPPERFLDGVADPIAGLMPQGWAHRQLRTGRALLLIDGVDELPSGQRRAVRPWLGDLLAAYPGLRAVVTSRPAAAASNWLAAEGFATSFLERMSPADVRALIRHWHAAVREASDLPCAVEDLPAFEAALLARMEAAPHLRALAGSPLLAAMLCALNLDREKQLPRDRMALYGAALELLLERRDVERQIPADQDVVVDRGQKLQILQELAFRLSVTGRIELSRATALRRVEEKTAMMPRSLPPADAVLDHLVQRSGVLREPVPGRIDFVHRTVQEYLTAKQFADDGDMEPLVAQAHRDQWRETVIMAAGHAHARERRDLLTGLLHRIRTEPRHARRLKLLVAACTETLSSIPASLRDEVEQCMDDLVPPRDLASARSLSNVGEPVLERLPTTLDGLSVAAARAVVRTAWMVNGPDALDLLARYGREPRPAIQEELVKAWEYFDPDLYARRVLADLPLDDGVVDLPDPDMLSAARHLAHLKRLQVHGRVPTDLSLIGALPQSLEHLYVRPASGDLSPLVEHAETLKSLSIYAPITDFSPLLRLRKLDSLFLDGAELAKLGFMSKLPPLRRLSLSSLERVVDFTPLCEHSSLLTLYLHGCRALSDLDHLPSLSGLNGLGLTRSSLTCGLADLARRAPNLEMLDLDASTWAGDLAGLAALDLQILSLSGCPAVSDVAPIGRLAGLTRLDLNRTGVSDLAPLAGLAELETLSLTGCRKVTDLAPLASLRKLRYLHIHEIAPNVDLSPLQHNRGLTIAIDKGQEVRHRELFGRRIMEWGPPEGEAD
jgi:NACHT domain-containing protein